MTITEFQVRQLALKIARYRVMNEIRAKGISLAHVSTRHISNVARVLVNSDREYLKRAKKALKDYKRPITDGMLLIEEVTQPSTQAKD